MTLAKCAALWLAGLGVACPADVPPTPANSWAEPMKQVHVRFTGVKGTFAQFGDSITVTMAYCGTLNFRGRTTASNGVERHCEV
jgi:hypothetical protein